jgi:hypothetical protein
LRGAKGDRAHPEGGLTRHRIELNALIPRGIRAPEGSGGSRRSRECGTVFRQRVCALKPPAAGSKPRLAGEQKVSGLEGGSAGRRSSRPGTSTSEWWPSEWAVVASERKAATRSRLRTGSASRRARERRSAIVERRQRGASERAARESCLRSSVPRIPAGSEAVNQVTWNHFFWLSPRHDAVTPFPPGHRA